MKTLKNLFAALFAVALLTSFVACSNGDDEEDSKYGCGVFANTEWVLTAGGVESADNWIKFTSTQYTMSGAEEYKYDVIINEAEKKITTYYSGVNVMEFTYEFKNDDKSLVEFIFETSSTPLTYKKK